MPEEKTNLEDNTTLLEDRGEKKTMKLKPSQNAAIIAMGMYSVEMAYIIIKELSSNYLSIYLWFAGTALILSIASCVLYNEFVEKPNAKLESLKAQNTGG